MKEQLVGFRQGLNQGAPLLAVYDSVNIPRNPEEYVSVRIQYSGGACTGYDCYMTDDARDAGSMRSLDNAAADDAAHRLRHRALAPNLLI